MPLFYKAVQSSIPSEKHGGKKMYHPRLVKSKKIVDTHKLGTIIAEKSSLTEGDVHNTIRNLMTTMREQLLNSRSVRLDGLGTFTVIASAAGNGVETAEEVNPRQIRKLKVRFSPEFTRPTSGGVSRTMFSEVEYERWASDNSFVSDDEDGEGGGGGTVDPDA